MKRQVDLVAYSQETINTLRKCGCLLVTGDLGKANVMTIGWGLIGRLWEKLFFIVAVRPSRYTYDFIEETGEFTVNVPKSGMENIVEYCGTVSGRDHNKFTEKGLTITPGRKVKAPIISECIIHYECRTAYKTKVSSKLPRNIIEECYPKGDYHTVYFGEILDTYAEESAEDSSTTQIE